MIADSKGKVNALVITSNEAAPAVIEAHAFENELKTRCGPSCKFRTVNVPIANWAKIPSEVQSALVRDPSINYVWGIADGEAQFIVSGVTAAGRAGKVKAAGFNGTPSSLKLIQAGNIFAMDPGENLDWVGYSIMDQAFRILAGVPPLKSENTSLRIFTKANVNQTGVPPAVNKGYGNSYVAGYRKLWGLK